MRNQDPLEIESWFFDYPLDVFSKIISHYRDVGDESSAQRLEVARFQMDLIEELVSASVIQEENRRYLSLFGIYVEGVDPFLRLFFKN